MTSLLMIYRQSMTSAFIAYYRVFAPKCSAAGKESMDASNLRTKQITLESLVGSIDKNNKPRINRCDPKSTLHFPLAPIAGPPQIRDGRFYLIEYMLFQHNILSTRISIEQTDDSMRTESIAHFREAKFIADSAN